MAKLGFRNPSGDEVTPPPPTAPSIPSGIGISHDADSITVQWSNNPETDLSGYNVYRSTIPSRASFVKLNGDLIAGLSWDDATAAAGTTYYYYVTAVSPGGESAGSIIASDRIGLPATPTGLAISHDAIRINLNWNDNAEPYLLGYNVYRSGLPDSGYAAVATLVQPSAWSDQTAVPGSRYYYRVTAVGPDGESAQSSTVTDLIEVAPDPGFEVAWRGSVLWDRGRNVMASSPDYNQPAKVLIAFDGNGPGTGANAGQYRTGRFLTGGWWASAGSSSGDVGIYSVTYYKPDGTVFHPQRASLSRTLKTIASREVQVGGVLNATYNGRAFDAESGHFKPGILVWIKFWGNYLATDGTGDCVLEESANGTDWTTVNPADITGDPIPTAHAMASALITSSNYNGSARYLRLTLTTSGCTAGSRGFDAKIVGTHDLTQPFTAITTDVNGWLGDTWGGDGVHGAVVNEIPGAINPGYVPLAITRNGFDSRLATTTITATGFIDAQDTTYDGLRCVCDDSDPVVSGRRLRLEPGDSMICTISGAAAKVKANMDPPEEDGIGNSWSTPSYPPISSGSNGSNIFYLAIFTVVEKDQPTDRFRFPGAMAPAASTPMTKVLATGEKYSVADPIYGSSPCEPVHGRVTGAAFDSDTSFWSVRWADVIPNLSKLPLLAMPAGNPVLPCSFYVSRAGENPADIDAWRNLFYRTSHDTWFNDNKQDATAPAVNFPAQWTEAGPVWFDMFAAILCDKLTTDQRNRVIAWMVQCGLDLYALHLGGTIWMNNGSQYYPGRKLPIIFAGWMLEGTAVGDAMLALGSPTLPIRTDRSGLHPVTAKFHEDGQLVAVGNTNFSEHCASDLSTPGVPPDQYDSRDAYPAMGWFNGVAGEHAFDVVMTNADDYPGHDNWPGTFEHLRPSQYPQPRYDGVGPLPKLGYPFANAPWYVISAMIIDSLGATFRAAYSNEPFMRFARRWMEQDDTGWFKAFNLSAAMTLDKGHTFDEDVDYGLVLHRTRETPSAFWNQFWAEHPVS